MVEDAKPGGVFRLTPVGMAVAAAPAPQGTDALAPHGVGAQKGSGDVKSVIQDNNCLLCHRIGRQGGDMGPSLNGVGTRRTLDQIRAAIVSPPAKTRAGRTNPMPSYKDKITDENLNNLVQYLNSLPAVK